MHPLLLVFRRLFDDTIDTRLRRCVELGYVKEAPSRWQLLKAASEMTRTYVVPGHRAFLKDLWRIARRAYDRPAASIDPIGILTDRDSLVWHLISTPHSDVQYDLEVLRLFPGGIDELYGQVAQVLSASHPRQRAVETLTSGMPAYHKTLASYMLKTGGGERDDGPLIAPEVISQESWYLQADAKFRRFSWFLQYASTL